MAMRALGEALPGSRVLRRPTQARAREKVQAILDATEALLETATIADLVMRDVASRASVKPATLYDYFPTKELLVRALEDRAWSRAAERVRDIMHERRTNGDSSTSSLVDDITLIVETFMKEMAKAARTLGLTPESPFGAESREEIGAQFAAFAAEMLSERGVSGLRSADDLHLRMRIATEAVALLTWVGARDHSAELEDGSYPRAVGRLIAHYFIRDPA